MKFRTFQAVRNSTLPILARSRRFGARRRRPVASRAIAARPRVAPATTKLSRPASA